MASAQSMSDVLPDTKAPCVGELEHRYSQYPWDFTTNSKKPVSQGPVMFLHCVYNNNQDYVDIDWHVPGVQQAIGPHASALTPRYSADPPLGIADGCLVYGNLRNKFVMAQFWQRNEDTVALDTEKKNKDCTVAYTESAPSKGILTPLKENMIAPFRIFLPATPESPANSLVAFEGVSGIGSITPKSYESFVSYRLRPAENSQSKDLKGYTISPRWVGEVERLAEYYKASGNDSSLPLLTSDKPVTIRFSVSGPGNWTFHELEYQLRNSKGDLSASLFVPAFVPAR